VPFFGIRSRNLSSAAKFTRYVCFLSCIQVGRRSVGCAAWGAIFSFFFVFFLLLGYVMWIIYNCTDSLLTTTSTWLS